MAYQIAFDLYEGATQQFLSSVTAALQATVPFAAMNGVDSESPVESKNDKNGSSRYMYLLLECTSQTVSQIVPHHWPTCSFIPFSFPGYLCCFHSYCYYCCPCPCLCPCPLPMLLLLLLLSLLLLPIAAAAVVAVDSANKQYLFILTSETPMETDDSDKEVPAKKPKPETPLVSSCHKTFWQKLLILIKIGTMYKTCKLWHLLSSIHVHVSPGIQWLLSEW